MQKEEGEGENPTYLYKVFEDTLTFFRDKVLSKPLQSPSQTTTQTSIPQSPPSTTQYENVTRYQSPLKEEEEILKKNIDKLKLISSSVKGSKLGYMIERYEKSEEMKYI